MVWFGGTDHVNCYMVLDRQVDPMKHSLGITLWQTLVGIWRGANEWIYDEAKWGQCKIFMAYKYSPHQVGSFKHYKYKCISVVCMHRNNVFAEKLSMMIIIN